MSEDEFECKGICRCGEFSFSVRHRRKDEDLIAWMERVVRPGMGEAHRRFNALCMSQHCDLKMPISEASAGIGMRVTQ